MKNKNLFGLGALVGVVGGAIAGVFMSPKSGKQNRQAFIKKMQKLEEIIKQRKIDDLVVDTFGHLDKDAKKTIINVKRTLLKKFSEVKNKWQDIDKDKYVKIVQESLKGVEKQKKFSLTEVKKLERFLVADWKKFTDNSKKEVKQSKKKLLSKTK